MRRLKNSLDAFIIGYGFVGKATAKSLGIKYYFDKIKSNVTLEEGAKKKYCFICLPTPTDDKLNQIPSRKIIHDYIEQVKEYNKDIIFIIRSTVLPGTCRSLAEEFKVRVLSSPELLSEATWKEDAVKPKMIIMGADTPEDKIEIKKIWENNKCKRKIVTDTVTAETMKYAFNTWFITKIIFANQLYDICQKNGAFYGVIKKAIYLHPWGTRHHFTVIHNGGRGGGGHCFPKDLKAFVKYSNSEFLKEVQELNNKYLSETKKE